MLPLNQARPARKSVRYLFKAVSLGRGLGQVGCGGPHGQGGRHRGPVGQHVRLDLKRRRDPHQQNPADATPIVLDQVQIAWRNLASGRQVGLPETFVKPLGPNATAG